MWASTEAFNLQACDVRTMPSVRETTCVFAFCLQACAAVRKACQELVKRLKPLAATLGDSYTWKQIIAKASPWPGMRGPVSHHHMQAEVPAKPSRSPTHNAPSEQAFPTRF